MNRELFTRRAAIGSIAASAIIAQASAAHASHDSISTVRPAFLRRIDRARRLDTAQCLFERDVLEPAQARAAGRIAEIPHTRAHLGLNVFNRRIVFSTANDMQVATARRRRDDPVSGEKYMKGCRRIAAAADRRDARGLDIRKREGVLDAIDRSNRMGDLVAAAEWHVLKMRVASAEELRLKIQFMIDRAMFDCTDVPEHLLADAAALAEAAA